MCLVHIFNVCAITGADDPAKASYLLEVYGMIVQLCSATKDTARMAEVYPKINQLNQVRICVSL
jgi:hypothetical protein